MCVTAERRIKRASAVIPPLSGAVNEILSESTAKTANDVHTILSTGSGAPGLLLEQQRWARV
jgi:hypothetical protein